MNALSDQIQTISGSAALPLVEIYSKPEVPVCTVQVERRVSDSASVREGEQIQPLRPLSVRCVTDVCEAQISRSGLDISAATTRLKLIELLINNLEPIFGTVSACGRMSPSRFLYVMDALAKSSIQNAFPKRIISVGSGHAFTERCLSHMNGVKVECFDHEAQQDSREAYLCVTEAEFPRDINKCLPDDCSDCILFSGFPQGYLGPILQEYMKRNGRMLCTTVEDSLFFSTHIYFEKDPYLLKGCIEKLKEEGQGDFFQVRMNQPLMGFRPTFFQFYNWPSSVRQLVQDAPELRGCVSDIVIEPELDYLFG